MKGLILAAGRGTRLQPLTDQRSKPMVQLAGRPLITWTLDKLADAGVTDIGIVVGANEDELRRDLKYDRAKLTYIRQPEPKGLAHAVSFAKDYTTADDFILLFCDNLFSATLDDSIREWDDLRTHESDRVAAMIHGFEVDDPSAFGVAVVEQGWVCQLEEKPKQPKSNLAVVGIDFFTPAIYEAIGRIKPSARGELEITDAMSELIAMDYRVRCRTLPGFWFDTGTFADLITAQRHVLDELAGLQEGGPVPGGIGRGKVRVADTASLEDCTLIGPVLIESHSVLRDCKLGPNVSVGSDCALQGCTLWDCQVYPGTQLKGVEARGVIFDGELRVDAGLGEAATTG